MEDHCGFSSTRREGRAGRLSVAYHSAPPKGGQVRADTASILHTVHCASQETAGAVLMTEPVPGPHGLQHPSRSQAAKLTPCLEVFLSEMMKVV